MRSTISADVKAANSKLAQFLRLKEEEEMLLQIGKRKPKGLREEKRVPGGRARWSVEPDFRVPTCMVDRPHTATGATSFHFSCISISKQAVPLVNRKPLQEGIFGKLRQSALEHSKYIERDSAPEVSAGVAHAGYIERPDAIERKISATVSELPTVEEATMLGSLEIAPDGMPSVFSNISDDPFERQEYWRAVERCERTPRSHHIILNPETSPRWWAALSDTDHLDPGFKEHALFVAEQYRQHLRTRSLGGESGPTFKADPYKVNVEQAGKLINQALGMPGFDCSQPPLEFKSGRGGRVQTRFVAELPHEISATDRAFIVRKFCDRLAKLETRRDADGTERTVGMMYTAVIHAPDAHNDSRNYHVHIVAHDRPARYLEEEGIWDFEFQENYVRHRKTRTCYPYRQNKIAQVSQPGSRTGKENSGKQFIPAMRREFARITNEVLKARGIERRYDPRKYTEMGIDRTPTDHLGTKAAALEAIGVVTVVGQLNAIAIWNDAARAIERQADQRERETQETQHRFQALAIRLRAVAPEEPILVALNTFLTQREAIIDGLGADRRLIMTFDHMEAKAKSRAARTRRTCLKFLADIESGKADRSTRAQKLAIQGRWQSAQDHIMKIDAVLQPYRESLAQAARHVELRESQLAEIDASLANLRHFLERTLQNAAQARANTPVSPSIKPSAGHETASANDAVATVRETEVTANVALQFQAPLNADSVSPVGEMSSAEQAVSTVNPPSAHRSKEVVPGVPMSPLTILGLAITKSTIGPAPVTPKASHDDGSIPLPQSPDTLGSTQVPTFHPVVPKVVRNGIAAAKDQASSSDRGARLGSAVRAAPELTQRAAAPKQAQPVSHSRETADEDHQPITKVRSQMLGSGESRSTYDRTRTTQDPTRFDRPTQAALPKADTQNSVRARWENLLGRIASERVPVAAKGSGGGLLRFTVPSLNPAEQKLLMSPRLARLTSMRLAGIHANQQLEINRLVEWISSSGRDASKLVIKGRTATLGEAPKAVRTLFRNWGRHPRVIETVRAENDRRIELARSAEAKKQPVRDDLPARLSRQEMLDEAAARYPAPDQVYTPEVSEFTRLLRELATPEELQAAAERIHASVDAREDINRHTAELATAYSQHVEGVDYRAIYRGLQGQHERG